MTQDLVLLTYAGSNTNARSQLIHISGLRVNGLLQSCWFFTTFQYPTAWVNVFHQEKKSFYVEKSVGSTPWTLAFITETLNHNPKAWLLCLTKTSWNVTCHFQRQVWQHKKVFQSCNVSKLVCAKVKFSHFKEDFCTQFCLDDLPMKGTQQTPTRG